MQVVQVAFKRIAELAEQKKADAQSGQPF